MKFPFQRVVADFIRHMPISFWGALSVLDLKDNFKEGQYCDKAPLLCCLFLIVHIDLYLILQIEVVMPGLLTLDCRFIGDTNLER